MFLIGSIDMEIILAQAVFRSSLSLAPTGFFMRIKRNEHDGLTKEVVPLGEENGLVHDFFQCSIISIIFIEFEIIL